MMENEKHFKRQERPRAIDQLTQEELFASVGDICNAVNRITNAKELLEFSLKKPM